jgi:hypothetical protein
MQPEVKYNLPAVGDIVSNCTIFPNFASTRDWRSAAQQQQQQQHASSHFGPRTSSELGMQPMQAMCRGCRNMLSSGSHTEAPAASSCLASTAAAQAVAKSFSFHLPA